MHIRAPEIFRALFVACLFCCAYLHVNTSTTCFAQYSIRHGRADVAFRNDPFASGSYEPPFFWRELFTPPDSLRSEFRRFTEFDPFSSGYPLNCTSGQLKPGTISKRIHFSAPLDSDVSGILSSLELRDVLEQEEKLERVREFSSAGVLLGRAAALSRDARERELLAAKAALYCGDNDKSCEHFERYFQFDPQSWTDAFNIATLYYFCGDVANSKQWYERCLALGPYDWFKPLVEYRLKNLGRENFALNMSNPYSANYFNRVKSNGIMRWSRDSMPIKVFIKADKKEVYSRYRKILLQAFDDWVKVLNGRLSYVETTEIAKADFIADWDSKSEMDNALGQTDYKKLLPDSEGNSFIVLAGITIFERNSRGLRSYSDIRLRSVCLHEIGHALGLCHSTNVHDVMFYEDVDGECGTKISARDGNTIISLYMSDAKQRERKHGIAATSKPVGLRALPKLGNWDRAKAPGSNPV